MEKTPDSNRQPPKPPKQRPQPDRDVSDPHPGSVSDGTHPEANEDKSED